MVYSRQGHEHPGMRICLLSCYYLSTEIVSFLNELRTSLNASGLELVVVSQNRRALLNAPLIPLPYAFREFRALDPRVSAEYALDETARDLVKTDMAFAGGESGSFEEHSRGYFSCRYVLEKLISFLNPSIGIVWGASHPQSRLLAALLEENSIPTYVLERGFFADTLMIEQASLLGESCLNQDPAVWKEWRTHENRGTFEEVKRHYLENRPQKYIQDDYVSPDALRETLQLKGRKVMVFWGQHDVWSGIIPSETLRARTLSPFFRTTEEALRSLVEAIEKIPNMSLLFKPHPHDKYPYENLAGGSTIVVRYE